jgi:transposase
LRWQEWGALATFEGMEAKDFFTLALQLDEKWKVTECVLDQDAGRLTLKLDFVTGSKFAAPGAAHQLLCPVHDTVERKWRHLDFFQYETEVAARVPRIKTPEGEVIQVEVPWARPGSGFTLLMEAMIMLLAGKMPVLDVAELLREHDTRLWRVVIHHVNQAHEKRDWSKVKRILIDETSARRGHRYVTNVVDAANGELLLMVPGKGAEAVQQFKEEMPRHGASPEQIEWVCMDMSKAFRKGARESFPNAKVVFDRFHLMQMAGSAIDAIRRRLQAVGANLKGGRWSLLGNEENKTEEQKSERYRLCKLYPMLGRAIGLRDALQDILSLRDGSSLKWWCGWAFRSRLPEFAALAWTVKEHWDGILGFCETGMTNAAIEAVNGVIQAAKRIARGFRNFEFFRAVAYLKSADLEFTLPTLHPH